jgi:outer membrane murein-binding lipoprotein Lpp
MTSFRIPAALLAASLASACYPQAKGDALEQRLLTVEARQDEFRSTFDAERERLATLALDAERSVSELQAALEEARQFLQRTNADLGVRVDGLEQQLSELRGRLEESDFQAAQLRQELELLRQDIEIQLSQIR